VPLAYEVARALRLPLEVFVVRKLGVPGHREFAMGALASGGLEVLDEGLIRTLNLPASEIEQVVREERAELERREKLYRANHPFPCLQGRNIILVDDGLATGFTMRAAAQALRQQNPQKIIIAVPVGSRQACEALKDWADELVCLERPDPFEAVGLWYEDFSQTSDAEVKKLLEKSREWQERAS